MNQCQRDKQWSSAKPSYTVHSDPLGLTSASHFIQFGVSSSLITFFKRSTCFVRISRNYLDKKLINNLEPCIDSLLLRQLAIRKYELVNLNASSFKRLLIVGFLAAPNKLLNIVSFQILSEKYRSEKENRNIMN